MLEQPLEVRAPRCGRLAIPAVLVQQPQPRPRVGAQLGRPAPRGRLPDEPRDPLLLEASALGLLGAPQLRLELGPLPAGVLGVESP